MMMLLTLPYQNHFWTFVKITYERAPSWTNQTWNRITWPGVGRGGEGCRREEREREARSVLLQNLLGKKRNVAQKF
jgi:hypothetical protein